MPFVVVPYDAQWPARFAAERSRLEVVLAPWLAGGIEHVGSTAIPGMPAKPVIDMVAGVARLAPARSAVDPLRELGYGHASHRRDALWFAKPPGNDVWEHWYHLHLTEVGSRLWQERLAFRNRLRADPELAAEYRELKERLARASRGWGYRAADKREFVTRALAGAGVSLDG